MGRYRPLAGSDRPVRWAHAETALTAPYPCPCSPNGTHASQAIQEAKYAHKLVRACALAAGVSARLAHPHALRTYWATSLLEDAVPIHRVSNRLGHTDLRTTSRYAADHPDQVDDVADVLDRRHQAARRSGR